MSAYDTIRILLFLGGCALASGSGLHLIIWTAMNPPSRLPDSLLFASEWTVFRKFFLFPFIIIAIGLLCMALPIASIFVTLPWG